MCLRRGIVLGEIEGERRRERKMRSGREGNNE